MGSAEVEKAEQVLQSMNAEKHGNFKQAIMYYRQGWEYLPKLLRTR